MLFYIVCLYLCNSSDTITAPSPREGGEKGQWMSAPLVYGNPNETRNIEKGPDIKHDLR